MSEWAYAIGDVVTLRSSPHEPLMTVASLLKAPYGGALSYGVVWFDKDHLMNESELPEAALKPRFTKKED